MMCRQPLIAGAAYGRRGLAAEPRPREVRGGIPQERDRRDGPAQPDERRTSRNLASQQFGHRRKLLDPNGKQIGTKPRQ